MLWSCRQITHACIIDIKKSSNLADFTYLGEIPLDSTGKIQNSPFSHKVYIIANQRWTQYKTWLLQYIDTPGQILHQYNRVQSKFYSYSIS